MKKSNNIGCVGIVLIVMFLPIVLPVYVIYLLIKLISGKSSKPKQPKYTESQMNSYGLWGQEKDLVRKGEYDPWNFEENERLEEDDYYYEDRD